MHERVIGSFSIDVEDWFHILDSSATPAIKSWEQQENRVHIGTERLLEVLDKYNVKATMFWLGWVAERNRHLLKMCVKAGHEIASHGYSHVLAYKVGRKAFGEDIRRGKVVLEDIIGREILGFRAAGFSTKDDTKWTFGEIRAAGYTYDSSIFPASRGHGGMISSELAPYIIPTSAGKLVELPQSMIESFGRRISLFGGGYLRLAPEWLIKRGIKSLGEAGRPLIVYVHPREADPHHPRISLSTIRRFKCYANLRTTLPKIEMLCKECDFVPMNELACHYDRQVEKC